MTKGKIDKIDFETNSVNIKEVFKKEKLVVR